MVAFIKTPNSLILNFVGKRLNLPVDSVAAQKAIELITQGIDDNIILETVDPLTSIKKHASGIFNITDDGLIYVGTDPIPTVLGKRLVEFSECGLINQAKALVLFWENCKLNSNQRARTDLYAFLEHNGIPITSDGCFVAYRGVTRNMEGKLVDCYTGTFCNEVGSIVEMERHLCDPDPEVTCSKGLHVAAFDYAASFGTVLLEVKVNPKDVVAIPTDYNGQKMRTCRFEVLSINQEKEILDTPLYDYDDDYDDDDYDDGYTKEDYDEVYPVNAGGSNAGNDNWKNQKRDSKGRFLPKHV